MKVIDVDSHFYEPVDWLEQTDADLAKRLPPIDIVTLLTTSIAGDLLASLPPEQRPDPESLIPDRLKPLVERFRGAPMSEVSQALRALPGVSLSPPGAYRADERLAFMDGKGIDVQFVLPTFGFRASATLKRTDPGAALEAMRAYNSWAAGTLAGHTERLIPATMIDIGAIDWAIGELRRMRRLGSRAFTFNAVPQHGRSLAHPDYDAFWATASELGMIGIMHVGGGRPALDPGWANSCGGFEELSALTFSLVHTIPQVALNAMILGGVFERHPALTIVVAEFGVGWAPFWLENLDYLADQAVAAPIMRKLPGKPGDYARRNVKFTPLPDMDVAALVAGVGTGMAVFSSDYPHPEGSADAVAHYRAALAGCPDGVVDAFLGGAIAPLLEAA